MATRLKLGKKPARKNAVRFQLTNYVDLSKLPVPPDDFGHGTLIADWGMLGNGPDDSFQPGYQGCGDCVFAEAAHTTALWRKEAKLYYDFTARNVISDYSALTGYDPSQTDSSGNNPTDAGTDMAMAAEYRRTFGIVDALGWRHRVVAYMALDIGNLNEICTAAYLFDSVSLGIRFPASASDQFDSGQPWTVVSGSPIEGGHCVPCFGRRNGMLDLVTWGRLQQASPDFISTYCDEAIVYLTIENLLAGKTPEGFSTVQLLSDLAALKPQPASAVLSKPPDHIPPPHHKHLADEISELGEAIDRLTQKIETKNRLFVLQTGKDQPIPKGQT